MKRLNLVVEKRAVGKLLSDTIRVIMKADNSTVVTRTLKEIDYLCKDVSHEHTDPYKLRSMSYKIMKFNKNFQAEWFEGTIYVNPDINIEYYDVWKDMLHKYKFLEDK